MGKKKNLLVIKISLLIILIILSINKNVLQMTPSQGIGSVRHAKCQGKDEETSAHIYENILLYLDACLIM